MTAETDRIDPVPTDLTLESGTPIRVKRLKTRQFFGLLRIVTRGGFNVLPAVDFSAGNEAFAQQLMALVIFAIPEAEEETIDFVKSMVELADPAYEAVFDEEMEDPEIGDLVTVVEAVLRQEADDLKSLGNRLATMLDVAKKTGQMDEKTPAKKATAKKLKSVSTAKATSSSEGSQQPST